MVKEHGMAKSRTRHLGLVRWITSESSNNVASGFYVSERGLTQFSYPNVFPKNSKDREVRMRTFLLSGKVTERTVLL